MKKLLIILIVLLAFPTSSWAALMVSEYNNTLAINQNKALAPMNITADTDGEITAEHGMNIIIDANNRILWERVDSLIASGSAVDNGKISADVIPIYSDNYRVMHIPVLADFEATETVRLFGAGMRAYDREFGSRFFYLDLDGDLVYETTDLTAYKVTSATILTDQTPPYPPKNFIAEPSVDATSVQLSWGTPPDYDFVGFTMDRVRVRDGQIQDIVLFERRTFNELNDTDVQEGDEVTYKIYVHDKRNKAEAGTVSLVVEKTEEPEEPTEPPAEPETPPVEEEELDLLNRLFEYYKVRQAIKCLRDDSACLWAKINLIYAQEILGRSEVETSLSERDLYLMGIRIWFTEDRYQRNCVEAEEPAKTCTTLGRSIKRARYFLDKQ